MRVQSARAAAPPPEVPTWKYPVRLRHVLLVGLLAGAVWLGVPRARAAWETHDLAARAADYASCMVGPTGPELIRDDLPAFRRLVRRRLVAAAPDETPFQNCAALSRFAAGSEAVENSHLASAARFGEYGLGSGAPDLSLAALSVDLLPLADRAREAWPFVRGGYAKLIRPSLGAREAIHPVAPPEPGVGRGLPADRGLPKRGWRAANGLWVSLGGGPNRSLFTSVDEGVTFRQVQPNREQEPSGGCEGPEGGFALSSREDGSLLVSFLGTNREASLTTAVLGEHALLAVTCDALALVAVARREGRDAADLVLCKHQSGCAPLRLPARRPFSSLTHSSFDVARVSSATVVMVEQGGIVRVISTRDDGRTWTPPTIAFDAADGAFERTEVRMPTRLLAIGSRLFLYGATRGPRETYPLLVSDDQGASFRALERSSPVSPPARVARGAP